MTNTVPVLIEELEGAALEDAIAACCIMTEESFVFTFKNAMDGDDINDVARDFVAAHTEGPTVQVPASLVGGE